MLQLGIQNGVNQTNNQFVVGSKIKISEVSGTNIYYGILHSVTDKYVKLLEGYDVKDQVFFQELVINNSNLKFITLNDEEYEKSLKTFKSKKSK